jgi:hypothetical protein
MHHHLTVSFIRFALRRAVWLAALTVPLLFAGPTAGADYQQGDGLLKLSNAHYEIAFREQDGSIAYLLDKQTNQNVSDGSGAAGLWSAALDNNQSAASTAAESFTYAWDSAGGALTLTYGGPVAVQVTARAGDALTLQAAVTNHSGANLSGFELPGQLKIAEAGVQDALLPMMPGALIHATFFKEGRSFADEYPGVMFADYVGLRSAGSALAVYTRRGDVLQPAILGFKHQKDADGYTGLSHSYRTWIADGKSWTSPTVVIRVGEDYPQTIAAYRTDNRIDRFPSLAAKLGDRAEAYYAAPMLKLDVAALRLPFRQLVDAVVNKLNIPGMVHFAAYTVGGHDHHYPDFIPPDPKWGTTDDFAALVAAIHDRGGLVVPYTNFSWWNSNSPTLQKLPADTPLNTIMNIKDSHGLPGFESYGPNSGFVMNLHAPFVVNKIAEQHRLLMDTVGVDGIFEDQWGARSAPYDFNPAGLGQFDPATAYFEGVLQHYSTHAADRLMTEVGVDALAENGVGFMGTNYLWDMLGYRGATAGVTSYYPMAGMLLRDKVLLYQHDLAAETWTKNKDMLRWNLAQGYNLSNAFFDVEKGGLNMDNPWLNLVGVFQKYALSHYADELVTSFDDLGEGVTRTAFASYTVYADWSADKAYTLGGHTLPPGGVMTQANDGSVTAGVFTAYNGAALSDGDHYLVEVRSPEAIQVFQPVGADTPLRIGKPPAWARVTVSAYRYDGTRIGDAEATTSGDTVVFNYASKQDGQPVGYYQLTPE